MAAMTRCRPLLSAFVDVMALGASLTLVGAGLGLITAGLIVANW